jgi:quercetin dioxygenase-like cupin family protein
MPFGHDREDARMPGREMLERAKVFGIADLVAYQDGAVVSRTLIDREEGTVTVFSFDEGEGLSEHVAPFDAMVILLDGEAEITVAGTPHRVKAGQTIILPADRPHALRAVERFKMLLVMVRAREQAA